MPLTPTITGNTQRPVILAGRVNQNEPSAESDGNVILAWFDEFGRLVVTPDFPFNVASDSTQGPRAVTVTLVTEEVIITAPGANVSIYVTHLMVSNSSGTATRLDLLDGAGGDVRVSQYLRDTGGGFSKKCCWKLTANAALISKLSVGVTDVRINVDYFVAA